MKDGAVRPRVLTPPGTGIVATLTVALAGGLVWRSIVALGDLDGAARLFRLSVWMGPGVARFAAAALAALGLAAAGALIWRRTGVAPRS